jgi:hypothetical protein
MTTSKTLFVPENEGRELLLEFTGQPPELTKVEFCYSKSFKRVPLSRGKPGLQWNAVAKAFSTCVLKYLISDSQYDDTVTTKEGVNVVFKFAGPPKNSYAASLGNAVADQDRWLNNIIVKKKSQLEQVGVIQDLFLRGVNVAGKNKNTQRVLHLNTTFLPRQCIKIIRKQTPVDAGKVITGKQWGDLLSEIPPKAGSKRQLRLRDSCARVLEPKVSVSHFSGSSEEIFGRDEWVRTLDAAWIDPNVRVFTLWAWGGKGKTAAADLWLKQMQAKNYDGAEYVLAWSFDAQSMRDQGSMDEFLTFALDFFDDNMPTEGERGERGERLARLVKKHKSLLILDGLESLQNPPSPTSGKLRDPAIAALLVELAGYDYRGLCLVTTRYPITELLRCRKESAVCKELNPLSRIDGRRLLRNQGVTGDDLDLEVVSESLKGDPLTLALLASYLRTAWHGNIHKWKAVRLLKETDPHGGHARSMMAAYEEWFKDKPEMLILKIVGLLDRPADKDVLNALRFKSRITGLSQELNALSGPEWEKTLQSLRDKKLVFEYDPKRQIELDAHPLVREYFEEKAQENSPKLWLQGNEFLCNYYSGLAKRLPTTLQENECLFSAVIHGCKAGRQQQVLNDIYIPRIMRGKQRYAAEKLGAIGGILSVLNYFFDHGNWSHPAKQLNKKSQLYVLTESARYLTEVEGYASPEAEQCYTKGLEICQNKNIISRVELLLGLTRCFRVRGKLIKSGEMANQLLSLSRGKPTLASAARRAIATNFFYMGEFEKCEIHAKKGIIKYARSGDALENAQLDINEPSISCSGYLSLCLWFQGKPDESLKKANKTVKMAEELEHNHTIAVIMLIRAMVHQFRDEASEAEVAASALVDFCVKNGFLLWKISGQIVRDWAISKRIGDTRISNIQQLISEWKENHAELFLPYWYGLLSDICLQNNDIKAGIEAAKEGLRYAEANCEHWWDCDLHRILGLLLLKQQDFNNAWMELENGIDSARKNNSNILELRCLVSFGHNFPTESKQRMISTLKTCYNSFGEGLETYDLVKAKQILNSVK